MESSRILTKIIIPANTVFDFAGDGLNGSRGKLSVDAGAGFAFNEWGRLILNVAFQGGLGYRNDALCINACEVASMLAGNGLRVKNCQLTVDFRDIIACGLKQTEDGKFAVDVANLAGPGLVADEEKCAVKVDAGWIAQAAQSQINNDRQIDTGQTTAVPFVVDVSFQYKPSGYGYNNILEVVKSVSTLTIFRNSAGAVVHVEQGDVETSTQDFDVGGSPPTNVAERQETDSTPNFYSK